MNPYGPKEDTLCYTCHKACGGCCWSDGLEPVPGWKVRAEEDAYSVTVLECPEYQKDIWKRDRVQGFDNDGCVRLMAAVTGKMQEDYIHGTGEVSSRRINDIRRNREMIEKFLRGPRGQGMLMLSDPEGIIEMLRKKARLHDRSNIYLPR